MNQYRVARLDEIEELSDGREPWRPVRDHFGITSFGVNAWTAAAAGDRVINEHDEGEGDDQEELYFVLRGRARFEVGDDEIDAPAGTLVFVPPRTRRAAVAEDTGTTILAFGGQVGKPYEPDGWEIWAPAHPLYEAGDYAGAVEKAREVVEANPEYAAPLYNLACCEALAGMPEEAIGHLRAAVDRRPSLRDLAKEDTDFDPIRDESGFKELVA
jgi:tetratricopeptide (TPR) repeat protein